MYYTIYKITNLINKKYYYGMHKTNNINDNYFGSGIFLKRAILKYGIDNFKKEILHIFDSYEEMVKREIELVTEEVVKDKQCYNLTVGGYGGNRITDKNHHTWSPEHANKISKLAHMKAAKDEKFAKIWAKNNSKAKILEYKTGKREGAYLPSFKGIKHSNKTKDLMSEAKRGKYKGSDNSQFGTMWITDGISNKKIKKIDIIPEGWKQGRILIDNMPK